MSATDCRHATMPALSDDDLRDLERHVRQRAAEHGIHVGDEVTEDGTAVVDAALVEWYRLTDRYCSC